MAGEWDVLSPHVRMLMACKRIRGRIPQLKDGQSNPRLQAYHITGLLRLLCAPTCTMTTLELTSASDIGERVRCEQRA